MRADRLVSLVLLLRQRGRMSAQELATELEVSVRTVMRDIEALSAAGVPVYSERGKYGGFEILPGFRTELTGLSTNEALALTAASSASDGQVFGLSSELSSAIRKVLDALPAENLAATNDGVQRFLVEPATDLLSRAHETETVPANVMREVRRAVLNGSKLRITYEAPGREPNIRVVDPIGLVTVREKSYLLATVDGQDRTYRLARIRDAERLPIPADRPDAVDLLKMWNERSSRFLAGGDPVEVTMRVVPHRREEIVRTALDVRHESAEADGWLRLTAVFQDLRHATWAVWQLDIDAVVVSPGSLRQNLKERAESIAQLYEAR